MCDRDRFLHNVVWLYYPLRCSLLVAHHYPNFDSRCHPSPNQSVRSPNPTQARPILIHPSSPFRSGLGLVSESLATRWSPEPNPQPHPISRSFLTASFKDRHLFDCSIAESSIPDQPRRPCPCDQNQQNCPLHSVGSKLYEVSSNIGLRPSTIASSTCPVLATGTGSPFCITASTPLGRINFVRHRSWGVKSSTQPTFHHSAATFK